MPHREPSQRTPAGKVRAELFEDFLPVIEDYARDQGSGIWSAVIVAVIVVHLRGPEILPS